MSPSLRLKPRFSPSFAWLLAFFYAATTLLLVTLAVFSHSASSRILIAILFIYLSWDIWRIFRVYVYQNHTWLSGDLVIRDNVVVLRDEQFATILTDSFSHPLLVVLRLQLPNQKHVSCVLFFDALSADDFRRLRVHLRHGMKKKQPYSLWLGKIKSWLS